MRKTVLILISFLPSCLSFCQQTNQNRDFNLDLEQRSENRSLPDGWQQRDKGYSVKGDTAESHSGNVSLLIESRDQRPEYTWGSGTYAIPAGYEGKEIELRAYIWSENVASGRFGLLLRIKGDAGILRENATPDTLTGTTGWKLYSIKSPLPKAAKLIYIGAWLSGTGKIRADDFQVLVDGKDISKAKLKKPSGFNADRDKEFDDSSKISAIPLTPARIRDLDILGKVWGFLKYYHPAVAKGEYNWDYELFRILPRIISCKNPSERNNVLSEWISGFGKIKKGTGTETDSADVKMRPDLSWITVKELGEKLTAQLSRIRDAKRGNEHYYIGLAPNVGNPNFTNESGYPEMAYPDAGFRLLSLYRYWNIIQYYFPYKNLIEENWNDVLPEFIPQYVSAADELEYKLTVLSLIARIHDTHANIWSHDPALQQYKGTNYAPLKISFIENKAVVTGYSSTKLGERSALRAGDIIESVNDKSVEEIVKERLPYTPASNYPTQLRNIARDLLRTNDTVLRVTYQRGNAQSAAEIRCYSRLQLYYAQENKKQDTCFKMLSQEIAYLYPGSIKNEYLPEIMPEILKSKGLIIDFRSYPSDFVVFSLSEYLFPEPADFVKFSSASIASPGLFTYNKGPKVGENNENCYKGKIVILINETTQSSAEYHTMAFRTAPGAVVIGSTTAGADGNVSRFALPGGISTMISGIGIYYPDGRETQRIGIVPDIEIRPTIKGIAEGRDELLEKAIEIINNGSS